MANLFFKAVIVVFLIIVAGCAANKIDETKYSGFLGNYDGLKPSELDKETLVWVDKSEDYSKYKEIFVDDVKIITPDNDSNMGKEVFQKIARNMKQKLITSLGRKYTLTDKMHDQALNVQFAIASVFESYDDMKAYQYLPITAAVTGALRATGVEDKKVRVMVEVLVKNNDGKVLMRAVDLKAGQPEAANLDAAAAVDKTLEIWADRFTNALVRFGARQKG